MANNVHGACTKYYSRRRILTETIAKECKMHPEEIHYDHSTTRRMRNFFILVLAIIEERRENSRKPEDYIEPEWEYRYIEEAIRGIDQRSQDGMILGEEDNRLLLDAFDVAGRIFHSRVMSLHEYYRQANKMVDECNGRERDLPVSLLLKLGAPKKKGTAPVRTAL